MPRLFERKFWKAPAGAAALAAISGFSSCIYLFRPGFMTPDPTAQLAEARSMIFTDMHPPIMALLWHYLDLVIPGPLGMLLFHNLLFWSALAILAQVLCARRWTATLCVLAFGFFPPVFALLGMVWKDVGMGVSLLMGCSLVALADQRRSRSAIIASLFFFFYGLSVRPNALPALWPLLIWASWIIGRQWLPKRIDSTAKAWALGTLATAILFGFNLLISGWLIQGRQRYSYQPIFIHDLAAISAAQGTNEFPDFLRQLNPRLTPEYIKDRYNPVDVAPLLFDGGTYMFERPDQVKALSDRWWEALRAHPRTYLRHRWNYFVSFLSVGHRAPETYAFRVMPDDKASPPVYSAFHDRLLARAIEGPFERLQAATLLFSNGTYILGIPLLLLGGWLRRKRWDWAQLGIGLSGLFYSLPYLLIGSGSNFRYSWWTLLCALLLIGLMLSERRQVDGAAVAHVL